MAEQSNGWDDLKKEVKEVFGEDFQINPRNCQTCCFRENVVTHNFVDTTCGVFLYTKGLFSLRPDYVKFTMIFGCPRWYKKRIPDLEDGDY